VRLGVDGRELVRGVRTGIGRYLIEVLRAATQQGWECLVYGDQTTELNGAAQGATVRRLTRTSTQWWDQVTLPRGLARDRVSVFLSPYYKGPLWAPCPVVLTIHDLFFIGYPGARRPLYDRAMTGLAKLYARRAAAVIADSDYSKRAIATRLQVDPSKVHAIPVALGGEFRPTISDEATLRKYGIAEPYLLYVGNFKPHKNLPRLLQAYAALSPALRGRYRLVLAGGDAARRPELDALAWSLGIADHVHFPGLIDDRDLPLLYSACALFVLPSLEEGFGLPALEAMACGAPVAASNRAAIPEVVGAAALLFDPEDVSSMVKAMTAILSDAGLSDDLRRRGIERAGEFSRERTTGRVLSLLHEVGLAGG
jgi:glycosyltransferase involved in cell wall biosynthesis